LTESVTVRRLTCVAAAATAADGCLCIQRRAISAFHRLDIFQGPARLIARDGRAKVIGAQIGALLL
jgi:hypothetical protein